MVMSMVMGAIAVQSQDEKLRSEKRDGQRGSKGRVVSMRAWRARKRWQSVRGFRSWPMFSAVILNRVLVAIACVFAVVSCIPHAWQPQAIIYTWFFAVIGSALSLVLHALRERRVTRELFVYVVCMAISFVVALVRVAIR
ncbi:hypothetical protein GCM10025857_04120 [Alicyclobacillus contaminans]|uniref:hypothetical protein n=1 Tax=Alicyclobacillus contaminans TaxID=392016 RepID=UPI0004105C97|nr:hypothetical protein [Alicyclobacillus contaminans]GMA49055.1 hypothetical protein GCM10025857_04120 [Alicyclobacillus contaminans]